MAGLPDPITRLAAALGKLPGIGPRSAERLALHLVQSPADDVRLLAASLLEARDKIQACQRCGALTERQPCAICDDTRRESSLLCVVETPVDILRIEKSGAFRGRFHVLGGHISPTGGVGPEELRIGELENRLAPEGITEIILALSGDVEGDATCYYLAKRLGHAGLKVTRLAQGLPAGAGLEFADEITLSRALEGRRAME